MLALLLARCGTAALAEPLPLDGWSATRHEDLSRWLATVADASRPCSGNVWAKPPPAVKVVDRRCTLTRKAGNPASRARTLRFEVAGARWSGHPIVVIRHEQQFLIPADFVAHASTVYTIAGPSALVSNKLRAWWSERGLEIQRDERRARALVRTEAGREWLRGSGHTTLFATEFYE